jgi:hypothetical protein
MKEILVIALYIYISAFVGNPLYSQENKDTTYINVLKQLLKEELFDLDEYMVKFQNDTCFFYNSIDDYIEDTEKHFEFNYKKELIRIWPGDYIFYYDIKTFVKIVEFNSNKPKAQTLIEKHKDGEIIGRLSVNLKWKNGEWKIKKVKKIAFEKSHINK